MPKPKRRGAEAAADRIRSALEKLPEAAMTELAQEVRAGAREKGLFLQGEEAGSRQIIPLVLAPWVFSPAAARYLQALFRGFRRTVNRILTRYFDDPKLQAILPLRESELAWLKASCSDGIPRPQTIFERFDTNLGPRPEDQLADFQIIEFNAVGVGCVHLSPAACEVLKERLLPRLQGSLEGLTLAAPADYRQLLLSELQAHSRGIERPECRVGLLERRETTPGGSDEFSFIAAYFREKGVPAVVGDPREVRCHNGTLRLKEEPVDILYRDFQIEEVVSIKTHGGDVAGLEEAFARNQVVSSLFGEFDHKSLCELLSNPEFAEYLTPQEVRAARRRIPWTRLIEERRTADPEGKEVDLIPHIRQNQERMVLKPNRGYGGEGVVVGAEVSAARWEQAVAQAVEKPKSWVTQEQVKILKAQTMILGEKGRPDVQERYVTLGVTATARGVSFVGRCSEQAVVNISQGGGLVPVFPAGKPK